jgi:hypothetical protein
MWPRFSIARLLLLIGFVAVGFAALRQGTQAWATGLFSLALLVLGVAWLGAAFPRGFSRAFYAGTAFWRSAYMMLCYGPGCSEVRPFLATTALIESIFPRIHPGQAVFTMGTPPPSNLFTRYSPGRPVTVPRNATLWVAPGGWVSWPAFERIGHSLFSFLFSLAGGGVARYLAARPAGAQSRDGGSGP